jgi:hypothetical protein
VERGKDDSKVWLMKDSQIKEAYDRAERELSWFEPGEHRRGDAELAALWEKMKPEDRQHAMGASEAVYAWVLEQSGPGGAAHHDPDPARAALTVAEDIDRLIGASGGRSTASGRDLDYHNQVALWHAATRQRDRIKHVSEDVEEDGGGLVLTSEIPFHCVGKRLLLGDDASYADVAILMVERGAQQGMLSLVTRWDRSADPVHTLRLPADGDYADLLECVTRILPEDPPVEIVDA